ncbi:SDR family NAD(P)-dependent oxidoreductase [Nevskia sp.]|uniref:SDR family NAD(P)-dependent oxidoreductase n=1 Tax=Nevskia sp. TaxID=1929292 RepID=UPI0025F482F8|nr:SDR family NAD(P)-dependent oxidoreductase [Nevskia sp.]
MTRATAIVFGVGTARGVGGAVCKRFAREGYDVIVAGRTPAKINQVVVEIAATGSAEALPTNVTDEAPVIAAFDRARGWAGTPKIRCNPTGR